MHETKDDIQKNISPLERVLQQLLQPADVLLIVPPGSLVNYQSLAAHTLEACAKEKGFSVQIFYANILFASHIGEDYDTICNMSYSFIGERIFARAAFGENIPNNPREDIYNYNTIFGAEKAGQIGNPLYFYPPAGRLSISGLKKIEEQAFQWIEQVSRIIADMRYNIVGCTSSYEQTNAAIAFLKRIKTANPETTTLLGGYNCEGTFAEGIASLDPHHTIIDYIFSGESETAFTDLLINLKNGAAPENQIIYGKPFPDLDSLPENDFTQYFQQLYSLVPSYLFNPQNIKICFETSRGCWWGEKNQCRFCGFSSSRLLFRQKSPSKVLSGIEQLQTHRAQYLHMADLIMPQDYFTTLLPELARKQFEYIIYYEQKANLSYKKLKALKQANITEIQPGLETLSNSLLKQINKGITSWNNIRLLRDVFITGISIYWNLIWGFPGEKIDEYKKMLLVLPLLFHLPPPIAVFHLGLTRFSDYINNNKTYGIQNIRPLESYKEIFPSYADISKLAYFFIGDYEAETYHHQTIITQLIETIELWNELWESRETRSRLHLSKKSPDNYLLADTRALTGTQSSHTLNKKKARAVIRHGEYTASKEQDWAIDNKAALLFENNYVSLVTADPELMDEFLE
ncbi:MAG: RiPP maturation radical SAM protein 1 [bacterium]|nr:RiPP maturation radical SAM protein 1 [bacterium]